MPLAVSDACRECFAAHRDDCSGFAKAVAALLGVPLAGDADEITQTLRGGGAWTKLADGVAAQAEAAAGKFVVGGLKGSEQRPQNAHGHVVVVVAGALAHGAYPPAWWGSLGGTPGQDETTNLAWTPADRDRVTYAAATIPAAA